jgi:hypothetical protein
MIIKLLGLFAFMVGALVAGMWVVIELAGAVAAGADRVWYLAVVVSVVPLVLFVISLIRTRSRGMVALTAAATVLLAAVLLTYPDGGVACTPGAAESGGAGASGPIEGLEDVDVEENAPADTSTTATDCS